MGQLDPIDFETAQPFRPNPALLATLTCAALSCLAVGALIGVYFGANSVALF